MVTKKPTAKAKPVAKKKLVKDKGHYRKLELNVKFDDNGQMIAKQSEVHSKLAGCKPSSVMGVLTNLVLGVIDQITETDLEKRLVLEKFGQLILRERIALLPDGSEKNLLSKLTNLLDD